MRLRYGLLIALALTGCAQKPKPVVIPQVVRVVVKEYVPVPKELTQRCPKAIPNDKTVKEAVRVARARGASIDDCNDQLQKIENLQMPRTTGTDTLPP